MIRVKAIRMKEMIAKLLLYVLALLSAYLFLISLLHFLHYRSKVLAIQLIEDNMETKTKTIRQLNTKILQEELAMNQNIVKKVSKKELPTSEILVTSQEPIQTEQEFEKHVNTALALDKVSHYTRPERYAVKELPSGKLQVGKVSITNYSKLSLDKEALSKVSDYTFTSQTSFLIYHTHTSEAYSEIGTGDNFRTLDDHYNVVAVGEALKENLLLRNFPVSHIMTKHDTPSYNGAYAASLRTVESIFEKQRYDIVIDLHRDALSGNLHFRPTVEINGEKAAKLMFVIGTNSSGLTHPGWMNNLRLALLIQNTAEEMYPGLFRDLNLSSNRYNQHVSDGAFIIEVGATGNTLEDTKNAMKYLANVIEALKKGQ